MEMEIDALGNWEFLPRNRYGIKFMANLKYTEFPFYLNLK